MTYDPQEVYGGVCGCFFKLVSLSPSLASSPRVLAPPNEDMKESCEEET